MVREITMVPDNLHVWRITYYNKQGSPPTSLDLHIRLMSIEDGRAEIQLSIHDSDPIDSPFDDEIPSPMSL